MTVLARLHVAAEGNRDMPPIKVKMLVYYAASQQQDLVWRVYGRHVQAPP